MLCTNLVLSSHLLFGLGGASDGESSGIPRTHDSKKFAAARSNEVITRRKRRYCEHPYMKWMALVRTSERPTTDQPAEETNSPRTPHCHDSPSDDH